MKGMVKLIGLTVITGAAGAAGGTLWNNVLEDKVYDLANKLKKKRKEKSKIVKFRKTK